MKQFFFAFLCSLPIVLTAQNNKPQSQDITLLQSNKAALERRIQTFRDSIQQVEKRIAEVEKRILEAQARDQDIVEKYAALNQAIGTGITIKTSKPINLMKSVDATEGWIANIPKNGKINILHIYMYPYYKVQYEDKIGYIEADKLPLAETSIYNLDYALRTTPYLNKPNPATYNFTRTTQPSAEPVYESTSRSTVGDRTIYTGPRGGRYHYSASGKKVYEKKKKN